MRLLKDIFLNALIPMISYFDLEEFLEPFNFTVEEIAAIKSAEYRRRLIIKENPMPDAKYVYLVDNKIHREDGPAVIKSSGVQFWVINNKRHRVGGPAYIHPNGTQIWYQNDIIHNDNGPARIWNDGSQIWRVNGQLHRTDGPARIWNTGIQEWWENGVRVR